MANYLSLWEGVKYRAELFGGLLFVPHRSLVVEVNHLAYRIIELIGVNQSATRYEICALMPKINPDDVDEFLKQLKQSEIIKEA